MDRGVEDRIEFAKLLDFLAGMHDGRMVPASKLNAYLGGGIFGYFPDDEHGYLSGQGNVFASFFSLKVRKGQLVMVGDHPDD